MRPLTAAFFFTAVFSFAQDAAPQPQTTSQQQTPAPAPSPGWRRIANSRPVVDEPQPQAVPQPGPDEVEPPQQQQYPQPRMQQQAPRVASRPAPGQIIIPAGTWINVRVDQLLSSEYNHPGDAFGATLAQPIIADGYVVARRGQTITGRITEAVKAGRVKGTSRLGIEIAEIGVADGQQIPVRSQLVEFSAGPSKGNDAAIIGTTTGVGAAIGAAAGGGFGAGMGAIAGAGASTIGVLLGRGKATEVPPESIMKFRLTEPVTINTERSAHAFQPVQQQDYDSNRSLQQRVVVRQPGYYAGAPYYYPYYWGPGYGYWGPGWGWGPSFYVGGYYRGGGYRGGFRGHR